MLKAYKYRMYPTKEQEEKFFQHFGACRFIYNWALEQKIKSYEQDGKSISRFDLNKGITILKRDGEHEWLKDVNSQSLQGATLNLDNAFTRFFREKRSFPKFKSKKNPVQAYNVPQNYKVDFENNKIYLPKIGNVKTILHRHYGDGDLKTATVSRTSTGKYYISILVDNGLETPKKSEFSENDTVGIDVGIKDFAITSNGNKIDNPKHLRNSMKRLKVLSKRLSRKQKGSKNRKKARQKIAKIHEKISNQRHDFQHKVSTKLISENQAVVLETLNVSGMLKNHNLAQHISDASWSSFVTKLEYKAEWYGKTILRIGQFEPSTKICNVCGYHNKNITLADRKWQCHDCGTSHDRDVNAAVNIKKFALNTQNLIGI
ncbi:IS200/IS605 family element RNA-guided endonuclease TnpB [Methanohalophilus mahii]|uniref:Transposase, IS605 OrfB family n=1 Tax=Methanohalophilus mahii (strain ATCC 35705 / DSM 5219 / SLP) TaxID=547558 RepID=D5E803_METMS|nr:IS200/IS605 family element RNA-guided endonuclease TnpB [Methanohalophilus mahii]ADE37291.1 transposase, IS605 OrfB family [Methanohalophilus mahii DSM 5219]